MVEARRSQETSESKLWGLSAVLQVGHLEALRLKRLGSWL